MKKRAVITGAWSLLIIEIALNTNSRKLDEKVIDWSCHMKKLGSHHDEILVFSALNQL